MTQSADQLVAHLRGAPLPAEPAALPARRARRRWRRSARTAAVADASPQPAPGLEIASGDPLLTWLGRRSGPVDLDDVRIDTLAVRTLREQGVQLLVPLVTAGEVVGVVALGPPAHDERWSRDAREVLQELASRAAPAVQVGRLVERETAAARQRERVDHELEVARLVQQQLLPTELPSLDGWHVAAFYRPARSVGGDFYEFLPLADGRLVVVVGDVTDKGVPAALVMASTHALLRAHADRLDCPAALLATVNDALCEDIPEHMFVTCLAMVLDPATGEVELANAGHNLPLVRRGDGVEEVRATGLPLGLMPGARYDRVATVLEPGNAVLLYSDGLTEAHDGARRMFGVPRLRALVDERPTGADLIERCLAALDAFTDGEGEQEDDITLVTLARGGTRRSRTSGSGPPGLARAAPGGGQSGPDVDTGGGGGDDELLARFGVPSVRGTERRVADRAVAAAAGCGLDDAAVERLRTAVAETVMNAIEHGNGERPDVDVDVAVWRTSAGVRVEVTDQALTGRRVDPDAPAPDLDLKLAGLQTPRGWGLFLVRSMVDAVDEQSGPAGHTVRLHLHRSRR